MPPKKKAPPVVSVLSPPMVRLEFINAVGGVTEIFNYDLPLIEGFYCDQCDSLTEELNDELRCRRCNEAVEPLTYLLCVCGKETLISEFDSHFSDTHIVGL